MKNKKTKVQKIIIKTIKHTKYMLNIFKRL